MCCSFFKKFPGFFRKFIIKQEREENRGVRMAEEGTRKKSKRGGTRGGASIIFQDEQILGSLLVFKLNIKDKRGQEEGRRRGGACLSGRSQRFSCILKGLSKSHNLGSLCTILDEQSSMGGDKEGGAW